MLKIGHSRAVGFRGGKRRSLIDANSDLKKGFINTVRSLFHEHKFAWYF